jgi:hypothetical protein
LPVLKKVNKGLFQCILSKRGNNFRFAVDQNGFAVIENGYAVNQNHSCL